MDLTHWLCCFSGDSSFHFPILKSCLKIQAQALSGKLPKKKLEGLSVSNAFAASATERNHKLGCLMSTQPESCCYLHLEQVESGTPLLWANPSSETLLIPYALLFIAAAPQFWAVLLVSWRLVCSYMLTVHCLDKFSRPVWSHKTWCHGCREQFIFRGTDCTSWTF